MVKIWSRKNWAVHHGVPQKIAVSVTIVGETPGFFVSTRGVKKIQGSHYHVTTRSPGGMSCLGSVQRNFKLQSTACPEAFQRLHLVGGAITHDGSMVLLYMVTWIPSIYPLYVSIYASTMDPMGNSSVFLFNHLEK